MQISEGNGIEITENGSKIHLDPKNISGQLSFISHSHFDHLFSNDDDTLKLCSPETKALAECRLNKEMRNTCQEHAFDGMSLRMKGSGHILGSSSLVIEGGEKLIYTGDVCTRTRAFLNGFEPEKCDTLLLETTFGRPDFVFPSYREVERSAREWVNQCISKGESVILMGYSLGKAQMISHMFREYRQLLHGKILDMNRIHKSFGVEVPVGPEFNESNTKDQFILISPPVISSAWLKKLKEKHRIRTAIFSGWAVSENYKYMCGADESFVLSDHADFIELKEIVQKSDPEKVYTHHGFAEEFAAYLKRIGFNAKAL